MLGFHNLRRADTLTSRVCSRPSRQRTTPLKLFENPGLPPRSGCMRIQVVLLLIPLSACGSADSTSGLFAPATAPRHGGGASGDVSSSGGSNLAGFGGGGSSGGSAGGGGGTAGVGGMVGTGAAAGAGGLGFAGGTGGIGGGVNTGGAVGSGGAVGAGGVVGTGGVAGAGGASCAPQTCTPCTNFMITCCKLDSTCGCAFRPFAPCN
jgi:hypothetical protein